MEFFLYFTTEQGAWNTWKSIEPHGYELVKLKRSKDQPEEDHVWALILDKKYEIDPDVARELLTEIAEDNGGYYDGWEATYEIAPEEETHEDGSGEDEVTLIRKKESK